MDSERRTRIGGMNWYQIFKIVYGMLDSDFSRCIMNLALVRYFMNRTIFCGSYAPIYYTR